MRGIPLSFHPSPALIRTTLATAAFGGGTCVAVHTGAAAAALAAASSFACATSAACVSGQNSAAGPGLGATSAVGTAITATGTSGLSAKGTTGTGVQGTSTKRAGVAGTSTQGPGVAGTGPVGVSGDSTTPGGIGVWGNLSTAGDTSGGAGVYASANGGNTAVFGESDGLEAVGVSGLSNGGRGVIAGGGINGVIAMSSSTGIPIVASANGTIAIQAETAFTPYATPAIFGNNLGGNGGAGAEFVGQFGLIADSSSTSGYPLILDNEIGANVFYVSDAGDVYYTGTLHNLARTASGANVTEYSAKTASPTLEDTGSAQLVNGAAVVRLDPTFAASIETTVPYRVFVTPDGDLPHGLFVAQKTPAGFVVREMQGGRATASFDYRVVATALGASGQRMSMANLAAAPHIPLPSKHIPPRPTFPSPPHTQ